MMLLAFINLVQSKFFLQGIVDLEAITANFIENIPVTVNHPTCKSYIWKLALAGTAALEEILFDNMENVKGSMTIYNKLPKSVWLFWAKATTQDKVVKMCTCILEVMENLRNKSFAS